MISIEQALTDTTIDGTRPVDVAELAALVRERNDLRTEVNGLRLTVMAQARQMAVLDTTVKAAYGTIDYLRRAHDVLTTTERTTP